MASPNGRRAVLVTGASTGIGRACALGLDRAGWQVFAGVRNEADAASLRAEGSSALTPVTIDVTDGESIEAAAATIAAAAPQGLAGLVNNAGISSGGPLEFLPLEQIRGVMDVNFFGQVAVSQAMLPLIRAGNGRIVNITSIGGRVASMFLGPYAASKHAFEAFTDSLRQELRPWGIWVAAVEPGAVKTPIWEKGTQLAGVLAETLPPAAIERYRDVFEAMPKVIARQAKNGVAPEKVFAAVEHALTSSRPRARYLVGVEARIQLLMHKLLPVRWMDAVTARFVGV